MTGEYDDFEQTPLQLDLGEDNSTELLKDSGKLRKSSPRTPRGRTSVLRSFPSQFVKIAQGQFPEARSQTDAIVAYMYCNCPEISMNNNATFVLTDEQKKLVENHEKNIFEDFNLRLQGMVKKLDKISDENLFLKMVTMYHLYDRLGLNDELGNRYSPEGAKNFDITDGGRFLDFLDNFTKYQRKLKDRLKYRDGARF